MNAPLVAVIWLKLKDFNNDDLAALNNSLHGFGYVGQGNRCFPQARAAGLIDDNGKPLELEELVEAASREVNKRVEAGTFN